MHLKASIDLTWLIRGFQATGYQRKSVKRKVLLLLVLLVVGMFILLMLKPKRKGNASNRPDNSGESLLKPDSSGSNEVDRGWEPSDGTPFSISRDVE